MCYKPKTKATRGNFLHQSTNSTLAQSFHHQDEQFQRAFAVLRGGVDQRAFPGAAVAIAHDGKLIAHKGLGRFTYENTSPAVAADTVYDLASVTKVIATTTACMILYDRGLFKLEQPLVELLPEFACDSSEQEDSRSMVTLRMLLAHSSGLPAYVKLFQTAHNKDELLPRALQVPLTAAPGTRAEYSDIGFILLGQALEILSGEPLDQFCQREIFAKLNLAQSCFNPPTDLRLAIPPTEDDRTFRHRVIQGEVNDENAYVLGGVAAHAGCFSTALDVSVFAQCMLRAGAPLIKVAPLVKKETLEIFTHRQDVPPGTSRALGWDTPTQPSQSGRHFSSRSYGHLGYTGTSLWIDPDRQLSVTLLTNRTWPDRGSQSIKQIRPAFHDAVIEALH
ncbi:MAG TPA: serine hydrolase domain-containing protein [Candidatus Angelobacter sp.]|nr:serine hydrolase domain-containing protein [Candidatus Angelobacter sp.]